MEVDKKREEIKRLANIRRQAALTIPKIKTVARLFDSKVYNCKFERAISDLDDDDNRFYVSTPYNSFCINWYSRKYCTNTITLLHENKAEKGVDNILFDKNKRIIVDGFIKSLDNSYARFMREATEFEQIADNLETIHEQVETLKRNLNYIVDNIPYEVREIIGLKHFSYY